MGPVPIGVDQKIGSQIEAEKDRSNVLSNSVELAADSSIVGRPPGRPAGDVCRSTRDGFPQSRSNITFCNRDPTAHQVKRSAKNQKPTWDIGVLGLGRILKPTKSKAGSGDALCWVNSGFAPCRSRARPPTCVEKRRKSLQALQYGVSSSSRCCADRSHDPHDAPLRQFASIDRWSHRLSTSFVSSSLLPAHFCRRKEIRRFFFFDFFSLTIFRDFDFFPGEFSEKASQSRFLKGRLSGFVDDWLEGSVDE